MCSKIPSDFASFSHLLSNIYIYSKYALIYPGECIRVAYIYIYIHLLMDILYIYTHTERQSRADRWVYTAGKRGTELGVLSLYIGGSPDEIDNASLLLAQQQRRRHTISSSSSRRRLLSSSSSSCCSVLCLVSGHWPVSPSDLCANVDQEVHIYILCIAYIGGLSNVSHDTYARARPFVHI